MKKIGRGIFLLLNIFILSIAGAQEIKVLPKVFVILPENSSITFKWIIVPSEEYKSSELFSRGKVQLGFDHKNKPVISFDGRILMNPLTGSIIKSRQPFKKMISLDNGAIIFSDGENLSWGVFETGTGEAIPEISLKPFIRLPLKNSNVFRGDENLIYSVGFNEEIKKYEIYLLNKKSFKKVATTDVEVSALSGNGENLYIASGRRIMTFSDGVFSFLYEHPREEILELSYSRKTGLFYKTSHGVGFIKDGNAIEFIQVENPLIYLRGTSLYVFLSGYSGLIEFYGIQDLNKYNFKVDKIVDVEKKF